MLRLNLLSEEAKKEAKLKRFHSLIVRVDAILIIGAVFLSIFFTAAKALLVANFKEFYNQDALLKTNGQEYNEKIRAINEKLKTVSKIQEEFTPSSLLIKELTDRIPDGVSLSYIRADIGGRNLRISGQADKRESFLTLRSNLSESPAFVEIDSPLQNILRKENVDFEINIKLDLSQLNKTE